MRDPDTIKKQLDSMRRACIGGTNHDFAGQAHGILLGDALEYIDHLEAVNDMLHAVIGRERMR